MGTSRIRNEFREKEIYIQNTFDDQQNKKTKITKFVLKEPNSFEYDGCVVAVEAASSRWEYTK